MNKTYDQFGSHFSTLVPELAQVEFKSGDSLAFAEFWFALEKKDLVPERATVTPADFASLAPNFAIYEFAGNEEIIVRLAGTSIIERYGQEITGMNLLDIVSPASRLGLLQSSVTMFNQPCDMQSLFRAEITDNRLSYTESIAFPMWSKQGTLTHIISHSIASEAEYYHDRTDEKITSTSLVELTFIDIGAGLPPDP
jgi:hypothetical protein